MLVAPYNLYINHVSIWLTRFIYNEIINEEDPLMSEELNDVIDNLAEIININYNRKVELIKTDLYYIIENSIVPELIEELAYEE